MTKKRDIVIAGYSETAIDFKTGRSAYDLGGEALRQAAGGDRHRKGRDRRPGGDCAAERVPESVFRGLHDRSAWA